MSCDSDVNTCIAKHKFGDQQAPSLQDYIETSLMLQYNIDLLRAVLCVYNCSTANGFMYLKEFF